MATRYQSPTCPGDGRCAHHVSNYRVRGVEGQARRWPTHHPRASNDYISHAQNPTTTTCPILTTTAGVDLVVGEPGFWRLTRAADGTWWFLSPGDRREF